MIRRTDLWTWQRCSLDAAPAAGESPASSASALHSFSTHNGCRSIAFPLRRHLQGVSKSSPSFNYFLPPCTCLPQRHPVLFPPVLLLFFYSSSLSSPVCAFLSAVPHMFLLCSAVTASAGQLSHEPRGRMC